MRIAYLANIRLPTEKAHGLQIMEMCRAFARTGHQVRLIVPRRKKNTVLSAWEFYGMKPEFELFEVSIFDCIPFDRWLGRIALWLNMLQFFFAAKHAVSAFHPDIVYSRDPWFAGLAQEGARYVYEAHDFTSRITPLHRSAWNRLARIVTVTEGLRRVFIDAGVPEGKLVVAHDGVDLATFDISASTSEARKSLGLPAEGFIAAYVGLLYPYKGADDLLEACALTKQGVTAIFVGGHDEDITRLKLRAEALGLKNAGFAGRVAHAQVPSYLRAADVAVLPTRASDRHASEFLSPLKLFEYLAAGKSIVATDLPSTREVLDERTAIFVPPGNPAALAKALDALILEPGRRENMERASLAQAASHSWVARAESVLANLPEAPIPSWFQRYRQPLMYAMLAFILRASYVVFFPQIRLGGGDELMYLRIADALRGAHPAGFVSPAFYQPLFPLTLAALRKIFGTSLIWIRLFQAVLSASTVFLTVMIAERWSSRRAGRIAGFLGALSVPMILESGIIYTETLYTFFVAASTALILWYLRQANARRALIAGAVMALAGLTREIGFYLGLTLAGLLAAIRRPRLLAAVFLLPIMMAMGAIVIRNIGVLSPEATTAAPLLSKGYEATLVNPSSFPSLLRWRIYPSGLWRFIRYPFRLTDVSDEISTKRVLLSGDMRQIWPEAPYILTKLMLILMHWIVLLSAAYGLWRGRLDRQVKVVFSVAIVFTAVTIVISGAARSQGFEYLEPLARYRFPVEPLIMILAAIGLERLSRHFEKRR